jgi:hypothetical protein
VGRSPFARRATVQVAIAVTALPDSPSFCSFRNPQATSIDLGRTDRFGEVAPSLRRVRRALSAVGVSASVARRQRLVPHRP